MISLIPMQPGYEANHDIMGTVDNITEQNWRGWCIAHWFLVGVDEDNVLLKVSGRQSHRTHHHCQLRITWCHMTWHPHITSRQVFLTGYWFHTSCIYDASPTTRLLNLVVCRVGEHQHRLAHRHSPCENYAHTWSVKLNIIRIWEWDIYGLMGWVFIS